MMRKLTLMRPMMDMQARRSVRPLAASQTRAFRPNLPAASSLEMPSNASGACGGVELDLSNPRIAFKTSSSFELARGIVILTACSQPWLGRNAEALLSLSRRPDGLG